ncbi:MAG: hypothetical protein QG575_1347, partial [Euryarchaeota archaeon]|nr:hypothetical protein [Euryarchaeota archaeon]
EILSAPGYCILMRSIHGHIFQSPQKRLRRLEVRKALREVDGSMSVGDSGHFADDRFCEIFQAMAC